MVTGFIDAAASPLRDTGKSGGASSSDGAPRDAGRFDAALDARLDRAPREPRARTGGSRREGWPPVAATKIDTTRSASVDARSTGRTPLPGEAGWKAAGGDVTEEAVAADGNASTATATVAVADGNVATPPPVVPPEITPELLAAGAFTPAPVAPSGNGNTGGEAGTVTPATPATPAPPARAVAPGVPGPVAATELPAGGPEGPEQVPGAAAALAALAGPGVSQTPAAETSTAVGEPASAAKAAEPLAARGPAGSANAARLAAELVQNTAAAPADAIPVELTTSEQLVAVPVGATRVGADLPDSAAPSRAAVEGNVSGAAVASAVAAETQFAGDDSSSQGDERRSPQYARLAAALAFASPSRVEDGGRPAVSFAVPQASATGAVSASAAVVAAAPAPGLTTTEEAENVARLVQTMRVFGRPGAWEATVRLKPEHMGEVTISLRVERNVVSAVVEADSAGVRQWLESQEQAVRSGMATHGLQLDRFVVHRDGQRGETHEAPEQESRRRSPRRAPVEAERFEVMV